VNADFQGPKLSRLTANDEHAFANIEDKSFPNTSEGTPQTSGHPESAGTLGFPPKFANFDILQKRQSLKTSRVIGETGVSIARR
jgi:hypothetical protein